MARPKGSKNIRTFIVEETAQKLGFDPIEILAHFAMNNWKALGYDSETMICESSDGKETFLKYTISPELRAQCARDACKYLYSSVSRPRLR